MTALRALLAGIVDYAGLFPPAALDMAAAVRNYSSYRAEEHAWMLGRFVLPVARLDEFDSARAALARADEPEWRLSALLGANAESDIARINAFNAEHSGPLRQARIDCVEGKFITVEAIERIAAASRGEPFAVFAEIPLDPDPAPLVDAIKRAGVNAKLRTGGVTLDAIPSASSIVRALRRCVDAEVKFKATAGLHHPLRADFPLTYDADAPVGAMFGYLNLFLAAGFMRQGMTDADARSVLEERAAAAIRVSSSAIEWHGHRLTAAELRTMRGGLAASFGSCSFREPVDELRTLILV